MEDYICRDDFCHLHLSILRNGVFLKRNVLSSNQKRWENGVQCKQTSLMLINVCKAIFIRRSTARSKTTKKSHVNWVCAACLYHFPRLHHHLYRLHRLWNNSITLSTNSKWMNLSQLFDLSQLISTPTRITQSSSTIIDHIYISNPENITETFVPHYAISDHFPVCSTLSIIQSC